MASIAKEKMMTTDYIDGKWHKVGPITFKHTGAMDDRNGDAGDAATCQIKTQGGTEYLLDAPYLLAIVEAIAPLANLFSAKENDKETAMGVKTPRGDIRLTVSTDNAKWGKLKGERDENYPIGRLVMNAVSGHRVMAHTKTESGQRDLRRAGLVLDGAGNKTAKNTRSDFIEKGICQRIRLLSGEGAATRMRTKLHEMFALADGLTNGPDTISNQPQ